jgi:hypothetical protein
MTDIPTNIAAIVGSFIAALTGAVAYVWKEREAAYKAQIARLESEVAAGRAKVDELQKAALEALRVQLADAAKRAETDDRVARSMLELAAMMKAKQ